MTLPWKDLARDLRRRVAVLNYILGMKPKESVSPEGHAVIQHHAVSGIGLAFLDMLDDHHAENYVEMVLEDRDGERVLILTGQRPEGKTPTEMRKMAEAERDEARADARILAHSYRHDSNPPENVVGRALAYPVRP